MENNNNYSPPPAVPGKGKATAALVLGIVSVVLCWFGYVAIVSLVCAIVGLIFAVNAKKEMAGANDFSASGMATAGLVLSIIGLALSAIVFIACTLCVAAVATMPWS